MPALDAGTARTRARGGRLLVVAYYFPPLGGVGVQRTLKFVTNLRAFGWRSVVLSPADAAYPVRDPGLLAEIPSDVEVVRVRCPEPAGLFALAARRWRDRPRRRSPEPASSAGGPTGRAADVTPGADRAGETDGSATSRASLPRRALRSVARRWVLGWRAALFPDEQALWPRFAVRAGRRIDRSAPVDAIFSSSPPITVHVIARALATATGRPWVADFRDPWVGNGFAAPVPARRLRRMLRLEGELVRAAARIVVASPTMAADLRDRHPGLGDRVVVIPNGYDRAELEVIEPIARAPGTYTIVYAGSIYGERELAVFLDGLERLLARRPELRERLRIEFVGRLNEPNNRLAAERAPALGDVVSYVGFVPRRRALAHMRSADGLLQLIADDPGKGAVIGGKIPEYLAFDLPILAVAPAGDARAVLEELGIGVVADPEPESISRAIELLLAMPRPDRPSDPEGRYDRRTQAGRLAQLLDEVAGRGGTAS